MDQQQKVFDEVVNQIKTEYVYNIRLDDENRVKLFVGEGGKLI